MWRVSHYRNHLRTDIQYRISFVESESLQETLCGQTFNTGFPLWRVNHYRKPFVDRHSMQDSPLWTVSQCWIPFDSQSIQESLCGQTFNKGFPLVESLSMLDSGCGQLVNIGVRQCWIPPLWTISQCWIPYVGSLSIQDSRLWTVSQYIGIPMVSQ